MNCPRYSKALPAVLASFLFALAAPAQAPAGGEGGLVAMFPIGPQPDGPGDSASAAPLSSEFTRSPELPVFEFYPMAGNVYEDFFIGNFFDLDPGSAAIDFECGNRASNGHNGSDAGIRNFSRQEIGVPIFAAREGIVTDLHDGEPDMNACAGAGCPAALSNFVILDHGEGLITGYRHMKMGSVAVSIGESVVAGQQIGQIGSSGHSTAPHLHFETALNNVWVDPFSGPCSPGQSFWTDQPAIRRDPYASDAGITHELFETFPPSVFEWPASGQLALADSLHMTWVFSHNHAVNSTWRFRYLRPDGTTAFDTNGFFNNAEPLPAVGFLWVWNVPETHSLPGKWTVLVDIDGTTIVTLPVEIRTARTADFNRPPNAFPAAFDPVDPQAGDVVFCRLDQDLINEDPDFDTLSYEYLWTVNGFEIRRVISAAHSDAIPRGSFADGDLLECTVSPSDGLLPGPPVTVRAVIGKRGTVWVNFLALPGGAGTELDPLESLPPAVSLVARNGNIMMNSGSTVFTGTLSAPMSLQNATANLGPVIIGAQVP